MRNYNRKGISLVELIVYLSILVLVLVVVTNMVLSMGKSFNRVRITADIERSAATVMDRLAYELRNSERVNTTESLLDTQNGKLVIESGSDSDTVSRDFVLASGTVQLFENDVSKGSLTTTSGVRVTELEFNVIDTSVSQAVTTIMKMEGRRGGELFVRTYRSTTILKNSY